MSQTLLSSKGEKLSQYLHKVYQYRTLAFSLAKRDIKVQYAQTALGFLWSVLQPVTSLLVWTFFFDKLIKVDTGNIPYPLFAFTGMTAWYFFTHIFNHAGTSLVNSQDLIRKIYFPRIILPLSKVLVGLVEFGISLVLLFIIMFWMGYTPSEKIIFLPVFIFFNIVTGLSFGIWLSALTIRYRDFQHIIPYFINLGIWLTPVFYPTTLLQNAPSEFSFITYFNPMAAVIAGYRWSLFGGESEGTPYYYMLAFIPMLVLLVTGFIYFRKSEYTIADHI
ncbi:MAG: ABC transporter permease [Chitinophagales bacterium]|nr:ABC transporter permease [Chitinophagales bacterium]